MLAGMALHHQSLDALDDVGLDDVLARAIVGGRGIFLVESHAGRVETKHGGNAGDRGDGIISNFRSTSGGKRLRRIVAEQLETESYLVPGR